MSWITLLNDHPEEMAEYMAKLDTDQNNAVYLMSTADGPDLYRSQAAYTHIQHMRAYIQNTLSKPPHA